MQDGRAHVVIENIEPRVDAGRFPIKRVVGDTIVVEADVFADGHDSVAADLRYRFDGNRDWARVSMRPLGNDRWQSEFVVDRNGAYEYAVAGWVDHFTTWKRALEKHVAAGQDVAVELQIGADYIRSASSASSGNDRERLNLFASRLQDVSSPAAARSAANTTSNTTYKQPTTCLIQAADLSAGAANSLQTSNK